MTIPPSDERVLNAEQKKAVEHGKGPLLIIAGAGTGKTTVITERIKHLIVSGLAKPSEILALTFTEKASREMEDRVDRVMPYGYTEMWISTFHSFCERVLRQEAIHIGLNPAFRLLSDADATMIVRKNLFSFGLDYFRPLGNPTKFIGGMLAHFDRLRDEDIAPSQYLDWVKKGSDLEKKRSDPSAEKDEEQKKYQELSRAFAKYQELKAKEGLMDFSDLIANTLILFRTRKNILKEYQEQFKFFLIDEFQDTNIAQNELVKLLVGEKQHITAVADDDQCLPAGTRITTPNGSVRIENIRKGDHVTTAVGKGYISISPVHHIEKRKKKARFIRLTTETGKTITATDNHKFFCHIPGREVNKTYYFVYLMQRRNLGWRLGMTDDLVQRLRLERSADRIIAIKACVSEEEARFYEIVYALTYGIPMYPFKPRKKMKLTGEWLTRLFAVIHTEEAVQRLAKDLGIDLSSHHAALGGVMRGERERVKVILRMCSRRHRTKWAKNRYLVNPLVQHEVTVETSSRNVSERLSKASITVHQRKRGWGVRRVFSNLTKAGSFAQRLVTATGGIFEAKFDAAKRGKYARFALIMPAGNIFPGMQIPILRDHEVVYERVISRKEVVQTQTVYDLEIERTHNYVANTVVVHNSIYKFRGAAVSNVLSFRKHFAQAAVIVLTKNYRSTQSILDASYRLIQFNNPDRLEATEGINKQLRSVRGIKGDPVSFIHTDRVENEAEEVAKQIKILSGSDLEKKRSDPIWKDFAILVRANNHAEPFVRALSRAGIPYQFLGPGQLFRQPEIKDLIAYLQVLANFEDNVALFRVLSMEYFDMSIRDLTGIANFSKKKLLSFFEGCEMTTTATILPTITDKTREQLGAIVTMIHRHLALIRKETAGQILFYFLQDTGMFRSILDHVLPINERQAANITKFFNKLKTYETEHDDASVAAVLDWILLSMELGESPLAGDTDWSSTNAVNILTIHSAKGLEFPVVFLVNLVSQRFPTIERREQIPIPDDLIKETLPVGDYHIEEERRLFYVGLTRARDRLYLTAANYYGEGKREKKLSPFIAESLGDQISNSKYQIANSNTKQLPLLEWEKVEEQEEKPVRQPVTYLSYSQIESFLLCPLHYKLRHMLGIQSPPTPALSFGNSVHRALKDFYELKQRGETVDKKILLALLGSNWITEGYTGKIYEQEMRKRGEKYLTDYFETMFDPAVTPVLLETPFTIHIRSGGRAVKIGGKIDRVDTLPGGKIEIVDYKTGRVPTQREMDASLQLSIYAMAAADIANPPFGKKPDDIVLSLYYFDVQKKISTTRTREQLDSEKEKIIGIAKGIETSDFRCSGNQLCTMCEYKLFCGITEGSR